MRIYLIILSLVFVNLGLFAGVKFNIKNEYGWHPDMGRSYIEDGGKALWPNYDDYDLNQYDLSFYNDKSTGYTFNDKLIYSEANGEAPMSVFDIGDNIIQPHFNDYEYIDSPSGFNCYQDEGCWSKITVSLKRKNYPDIIICTIHIDEYNRFFVNGHEMESNEYYLDYCRKTVDYKKLNPALYDELKKLREDIAVMLATINGFNETERSLRQNAVDLSDAINRILDGDFGNINPEDFKGILSEEAYVALRDAKRGWNKLQNPGEYENSVNDYEDAVDALESEVANEFAELSDLLYDINNTTTEELVADDIDPEDNSLTDYGITEINMDSVDLPNIDESEQFDWANNIYDNQATEVIAALEIERFRDRKVFLFIVNAWSANQIDIRSIILARAGVINGELEAFIQANTRVRIYLFGDDNDNSNNGILDTDYYFKDCIASQNTSLKDEVNRLAENFPNEAAILKDKLNNLTEIYLGDEYEDVKTVRIIDFRNTLKKLSDLVDLFASAGMDEIERREELEQLKSIAGKTPDLLDAITSSEAGCFVIRLTLGDAGDFNELESGKDLCTGKDIGISGRIAAGIGLVIGNGLFWRSAGKYLSGASAVVKNSVTTGVNKLLVTLDKYGILGSTVEFRRFKRVSKKFWNRDSIIHVMKGTFDEGTGLLVSGMHTNNSFMSFLQRRLDKGDDWFDKIDDVTVFPDKVNRTGRILREELDNGNGIIRLQMPKPLTDTNPKIFQNSRKYDDAYVVIDNGQKQLQGVKTLFPKTWELKDITKATDDIILQNKRNDILIPDSGTKEIYGYYTKDNITVKIRVHFKDGKVTTAHPTWEQ